MDKQSVASFLLTQGSVLVHLDPRGDVIVPTWLKHQPQLVLEIGLNLPIPIADLSVDNDGIIGTLSFSRTPFTCSIPWSCVFALVGEDDRGMVWEEDMPAEILENLATTRMVASSSMTTKTPQQKRVLKNGRVVPSYIKVVK